MFSSNPLSLSVPDQAFESWLRDSGYLEVLDQRTTTAANLTTTTETATTANSKLITDGLNISPVSHLVTLFSLLTFNPFAKLTTEDFSGETPSWTLGFFGSCDSHSFPSSPSQAKMRVQENVKRYARNYASLLVLFSACTLYQMPLALVGLISSLALWDLFKRCSDRWDLDGYPTLRRALVVTAQLVTAVILISLNVQMAILCALAVTYAVMVLHAAFRKLTPAKKPSRGR